ncbi:MAG TPA: cytochrome c [Methylothermaceae bacterium]|nr:cytochrome c [Methylothermaceae bacterium]
MVRFLAGIAGILLTGVTLAIASPSPERQKELRNLLIQDCGSCHGMTLKGGLGPPLVPEALAGKSPEFLRRTIVEGRPGTPMPPWGGLLSDADIDWLVEILLDGEAAP